ncbi:MAG: SCO family protein [Acidobacteria bacterium]|nr:SCO family protein [Acidobacteriota bacterium]
MKQILLLIALSLAAAPAAGQEFLSATGPSGLAKIEQRLNVRVPLDLQFVDENGKSVRLGDYFDGKKPVILTPVYYSCPMLCNLVLDGLVNALHEQRFKMGEEYEVVSFSFDPRDTPESAKNKHAVMTRRYGRPGSEDNWHFLTGSEASIRELTDAIGFRYTWDPKTKQFAHGATILLMTADGRISRYFYGVSYDPRDMRLGLVEASKNQIGNATDDFLLMCYEYDPHTGKYTPIVMNIVRLGGVATIVALAGVLIIFTRRDRAPADIKRD